MGGEEEVGWRAGGWNVTSGETNVEGSADPRCKCQEKTGVVRHAVRRGLASLTVVWWETNTTVHNAAECARERMRQYEEQGERFGDLFAQIPDVSLLNLDPFAPQRLDLRGVPGIDDEEDGLVGGRDQKGQGAVNAGADSHVSATPTPPSSPQPGPNV